MMAIRFGKLVDQPPVMQQDTQGRMQVATMTQPHGRAEVDVVAAEVEPNRIKARFNPAFDYSGGFLSNRGTGGSDDVVVLRKNGSEIRGCLIRESGIISFAFPPQSPARIEDLKVLPGGRGERWAKLTEHEAERIADTLHLWNRVKDDL